MTEVTRAGTYQLGDLSVTRMGYGAMQLAGPHVFGPPKDRAAAIAVLRAVVESGITHIDTSDFYGPTLLTSLSARRSIPIVTLSLLSRR
ncbi:aryl-alcohol dehydrogenase-like predicted oxidoreductase [Paraburkholderia youngii]